MLIRTRQWVLTSGMIALLTFSANGSLSPHPNLMWPGGGEFEDFTVEISADSEFSSIVDRDRIANVSRYVPATALPAGDYFWRVKNNEDVVHQGTFEIAAAQHEIHISAGSGMSEIRAALAEAEASESTLITFDPGVYELHPGDEGTVFDVNGATDLIVDGGGAKFVIHDIARLAEVRFSRHITFRNFTVDYEAPLYAAARVEAVESDGTMTLSLWPGHEPPEKFPRLMAEKRGLFSEPEYPRMAENVPLLVYMREAWEPLGDGRYRLRARRAEDVENVKPGMVYVSAPRYRPQGIEIYNSEDITFADVTTYYLPGIGVRTSFTHDLKLIRLRMLRRDDRLLAVQNGGTNIQNARIGPWVEGCRFENAADDNNHISALVLTPIEQPAPDEVILSNSQPGVRVLTPDLDIQPGDRLAFFDHPSGRIFAKAAVTVAEVLPNRTTRILVDRELPTITLGDGSGGFPDLAVTQIYNLDRACGNFVFRDNTFFRGRRVGILAKSGPGLIENNRFEQLGGGGVEIFNAPYEGLHAHDLLIQNNEFRRNGLVFKRMGAASAIWTRIFSGRPSQPLHRNIRIIGNRIVDHPRHGIEIHDAIGVLVEENEFDNEELDAIREAGAHLIDIGNTADSIIRNNRFRDSRFDESRWIQAEDSQNLTIE